MRRAHLSARAKMRERQKPEAGAAGAEAEKPGSASAIVINGEKLVTANMGEYRAIVCRDGKAYQISRKHWSQKLIPGKNTLSRILLFMCKREVSIILNSHKPVISFLTLPNQ